MAKLWQLSQGHPKPAFSEKVQMGNFSKIAQKVAFVWKVQKHSNVSGIISELVCSLGAKTGKDFGAEGGSKTAGTAKLWQFLQGHPKPAFSEKVQRGDQGKFLKNRKKKVALASKGQEHSGANGVILYLVYS